MPDTYFLVYHTHLFGNNWITVKRFNGISCCINNNKGFLLLHVLINFPIQYFYSAIVLQVVTINDIIIIFVSSAFHFLLIGLFKILLLLSPRTKTHANTCLKLWITFHLNKRIVINTKITLKELQNSCVPFFTQFTAIEYFPIQHFPFNPPSLDMGR